MNAETAWQAGRLGGPRGPRRLLFGRMYEDAEIERTAFRGRGRVFCIASAGTTALQLAEDHEVIACDINPVQLAYAERCAKGGPTETGDAERAMKFMRALMPLAGWREKTVRAFLALSDVGEQMAYWRERLDTWRFRAGFDLLMSPPALRVAYSPRFLSVLPARFGAVLRKRLARGFATHPNSSNPYAGLLLGADCHQPWPRKVNVRFVLGDAASWLESCPPGFFSGFALSNILDGAKPAYAMRLRAAVLRASAEDAVVVSRSFAEPPRECAGNCAEADRSMLWGVVEVSPAPVFSMLPAEPGRDMAVASARRCA